MGKAATTWIAVLIIALIALPATGFAAPAIPDPQLNLSHSCYIETGVIDNHFVLVHAPDGVDFTGTFVTYEASIDGGLPFTGVATFDALTGGTAHFHHYLSATGSVLTVTSASVTVGGVTYTLANAGSFQIGSCFLGVTIEDFTAICAPGSPQNQAILNWWTSSEIGIMHWTIARDGVAIATIPAGGSTQGNAYEYVNSLPPGVREATYTITANTGETATAQLSCEPLAVTSVSISADSEPPPRFVLKLPPWLARLLG